MQQNDMDALLLHTFLHIRRYTVKVAMETRTVHGSCHIKDRDNVVIVCVNGFSFHALMTEFGD